MSLLICSLIRMRVNPEEDGRELQVNPMMALSQKLDPLEVFPKLFL